MPVKQFIISRHADKSFLKLPKRIQIRLITAFSAISQNPVMGVKLHGELGQYSKYRVGDYRIIYRFDSKTKRVLIVKIEHRQGVYK